MFRGIIAGLFATLALTGCGSSFESSGSGAGGDDAGGAGGNDTAMSPGGAAGASESAGSAGATGHENACTKEMTFNHPTCMVNAWPTYFGAGCAAPCVATADGYWCCPR